MKESEEISDAGIPIAQSWLPANRLNLLYKKGTSKLPIPVSFQSFHSDRQTIRQTINGMMQIRSIALISSHQATSCAYSGKFNSSKMRRSGISTQSGRWLNS